MPSLKNFGFVFMTLGYLFHLKRWNGLRLLISLMFHFCRFARTSFPPPCASSWLVR